MIVQDTYLEEVKVIMPKKIYRDDRGYFFESYKSKNFRENNLPTNFLQDNQVRSKKNVIRGMHYQLKNPQGKLVRAIEGSIFDVAIDIRIGSPKFGHYVMVELSSSNKKMLYIPEGFAHGYLVNSNQSLVVYKCTNLYNPEDEYSLLWNDEDIGIKWNCDSPILSEKDKIAPRLKDQKFLPKFQHE
tara:strand:- start:42 stop:599 length:558 start_codon:yes stop_codon:yes gene_type:complete